MSASADHQRMAEMVFGYWVSQAIRAYAELSLADHLANGPLTAAEIAEREGAAPDGDLPADAGRPHSRAADHGRRQAISCHRTIGHLAQGRAGIAAGHGVGADQPVALVAVGRIRRSGTDGSEPDP